MAITEAADKRAMLKIEARHLPCDDVASIDGPSPRTRLRASAFLPLVIGREVNAARAASR
jgi:hypothetical protein